MPQQLLRHLAAVIVSGAQLRLRLKGRHRFDMLGLIISNGRKDIVQIVNLGPPYLTRTRLELVEHVQIAVAVVIKRHLWSRLGLELLLMFLEELIVSSEGMLFHVLIEIVRRGGIPKV